MSWHDDGELGLGPVVATPSLGSNAAMSWRLKQPRGQINQPYFLEIDERNVGKAGTAGNAVTSLSITWRVGSFRRGILIE